MIFLAFITGVVCTLIAVLVGYAISQGNDKKTTISVKKEPS